MFCSHASVPNLLGHGPLGHRPDAGFYPFVDPFSEPYPVIDGHPAPNATLANARGDDHTNGTCQTCTSCRKSDFELEFACDTCNAYHSVPLGATTPVGIPLTENGNTSCVFACVGQDGDDCTANADRCGELVFCDFSSAVHQANGHGTCKACVDDPTIRSVTGCNSSVDEATGAVVFDCASCGGTEAARDDCVRKCVPPTSRPTPSPTGPTRAPTPFGADCETLLKEFTIDELEPEDLDRCADGMLCLWIAENMPTLDCLVAKILLGILVVMILCCVLCCFKKGLCGFWHRCIKCESGGSEGVAQMKRMQKHMDAEKKKADKKIKEELEAVLKEEGLTMKDVSGSSKKKHKHKKHKKKRRKTAGDLHSTAGPHKKKKHGRRATTAGCGAEDDPSWGALISEADDEPGAVKAKKHHSSAKKQKRKKKGKVKRKNTKHLRTPHHSMAQL